MRWTDDDFDEQRADELDDERGPRPALSPGRMPRTVQLARALRVQRAPDPGAPAPAGAQPGGGASAGAARPDAVIVDDGADVQPGQLTRTQFLAQVREQVTAAAGDALGPVWSVAGCPYIESWFAGHAATPAAQLEAMARRYSGLAQARAATDYIPPVLARLRDGIARWKDGQDVSAELGDAGVPGAGGAAAPAPTTATPGAAPAPAAADDDAGGAVQLKRAAAAPSGDAEPGSPAAILGELGGGGSLGSHAARLGDAMGDDFGDVRVHTDGAAARKAAELGARAFTIGRDVAFAAGEYRPGTPEGDALLAHELAHVQQQRGAALDGAARKRAEVEGPDGPLELEADQAAAGAIASLHGGPAAAAKRTQARSWLRSGLSLKRCSKSTPTPTPAPAPPIPTTHGPDQHAGVQPPDAGTQPGVWGHLNPNSTTAGPGGVVREDPWDGAAGNPRSAANRAAAEAQLTAAMRRYLDGQAAAIARARTAARVPMTQAGTGAFAGQDTGVQGIAGLASSAIASRFGGEMGAAAMTTGQRAASTRPMQSGVNLFDGNDAAQRAAAMGQTPDQLSWGSAWWIATSTDEARNTLARHHWSPGRGGDEETVFNDVLTRWLAAGTNRTDALDYRIFGLNEAGPDGKILLITRTDPARWGGDANKADKAQRWEIFGTSIHETMHTRAHSAFNAAIGDKQVMREGFCEMYSKDVADPLYASVRGGGNETLRKGVEGKDEPIIPDVIPSVYTPASVYQTFYDHAIAIRGVVGDAACQAAFFQGHVELLGLNPDGTRATAPAAGARRLQVPAGIANVDQLAAASGVARAQLVADNPGIEATFPAGGQAVMAGCREHVVVEATDASGSVAESRAQIAAQNGVSEQDLVRANPGIRVDSATNQWPALHRGDRVLIPVH